MKKEHFEVNYLDKSYNIENFLAHHPGGINYLEGYREKNVTNRMIETNHSKSAFYLLREYKIGERNKEPDEHTEDLEELVNWSKPMLGQVASLGVKYNEWVTSPVDRKLRLFANPFLEFLTITPWYMVPLIWIPVIIYLFLVGSKKYIEATNDTLPWLSISFCVLFGVILWTFVEYSLHRWVFHMQPSGKSNFCIIVHFTLHGLHHKVPFDSRRLVFPPFPAAIVILLSHKILKTALPGFMYEITLAGGILGYVVYDMIHFYLHNGTPKEGSYLYNMKRYHNQHHFVHHDNGFGISNKLWDVIFGTLIQLRKLAVGIKW